MSGSLCLNPGRKRMIIWNHGRGAIEPMREKYQVLKIYEDDFGCEERAENYEPQVIVKIKAPDGKTVSVKQSDAWMYEQDINEGDEVLLVDREGLKLYKGADDIDEALPAWIDEAYSFAGIRRDRKIY